MEENTQKTVKTSHGVGNLVNRAYGVKNGQSPVIHDSTRTRENEEKKDRLTEIPRGHADLLTNKREWKVTSGDIKRGYQP